MKNNIRVKQVNGTWAVLVNGEIHEQPGCNSKAVCKVIARNLKISLSRLSGQSSQITN